MKRLPFVSSAVLLLTLCLASSTAEAERKREPLTRVHAIGGGYHFHWLTSDLTGGMRFHGPSVGYAYDVGRTIRFMIHAKAYFPVVGRVDNETGGSYSGSLRSDYEKAWGFDGTFAVGRKFTSDRLTLIFGGGVHILTMRINSTIYYPVEVVTLGAGGLFRLRRSFGAKDTFQVGVDGQLGADVFHLIRGAQNPVNLLITGSALATVGFQF